MRRIILAEDDADDQDIMKDIILELCGDVRLSIVADGEQLMSHLGALHHSELPDLIILDQNMPRMKGAETLQGLQAVADWSHIPAVIYTTSRDTCFADDCKRNSIELFRKPDTLAELRKMMEYLKEKYLS